MNILAILRAKQFSPNSVEKDEAIMMAVVSRLRAKGHAVEVVPENTLLTLHAVPTGKIILSMGRTPETLRWLSRQDACVVNSPESEMPVLSTRQRASPCVKAEPRSVG